MYRDLSSSSEESLNVTTLSFKAPDSSSSAKKRSSVSSSIELTGLSVNVGSIIYLTETSAPIGYGVNANAETLEVKNITEDGEVVLEQIDQAYAENRLKLSKLASTTTSSGATKTNYEVTLTDYQLDTFKFEINAVDSSTLKGVEGYGFNIQTSLGAQKTIETESDGNGSASVGGSIENNTITKVSLPGL